MNICDLFFKKVAYIYTNSKGMNILILLVGVSLFAAFIFLGLFIWNVRSGQYEDNYTPSVRILFEDDEITESSIEENQTQTKKEPDGDSKI